MLEVGATFGRYEIKGVLGQGGMGTVYLARDSRLARDVALKVLHPLEGEGAREELLREARVAAGLIHPNIVAVFDVGEIDGVSFLAMERVQGKSLRHYVGAELPLATKVTWLTALADALTFAHARGVVHRDVKPENVMVTDEGEIKVLDFGIARAGVAAVSRSATTRTIDPSFAPASVDPVVQPTSARGTPAYMAPEQLRGEPLDGRADQFAWGVVAYELLTGKRPWPGTDTIALVAKILKAPVPPLSVPEIRDATPLKNALAKAMAKSRVERFGAVAEAAEALRDASPRDAAAETLLRPQTIRRAVVGVIASALVAVLVTVIAQSPRRQLPAPHVAIPASTAVHVPVEAALAAYRAGMQAQHDGAREAAAANFREAVRLDPNFPEPRLRTVLMHAFIDDSMRTEYMKTLELRASLNAHDARLLEALEPWVRIPPDRAETERRFSELTQRFPEDPDYAYTLGTMRWRLVDDLGVLSTTERAFHLDPTFANALRLHALALIRLERVDEAREELNQCLRISAHASGALSLLAELEANEGHCGDYEVMSRKLIAIDPNNASWYLDLARSLYAQSYPIESVGAALEQAYARMAPEDAAQRRLEDAGRLAILKGDWAAFDSATQEWLRRVESSPDEDSHSVASRFRADALLTIGRTKEANALMNDFLRRRTGWSHALPDSDPGFLHQVRLYRGDGISREEFVKARATWLETENIRPGNERPVTWVMAFAQAARTSEDAREAISTMSSYGLPDPLTRNILYDLPIGTTFALGGLNEHALVHLRRAARSCQALEFPAQHTVALMRFGIAAERDARSNEEACDALVHALKRWPEPRSRGPLAAEAYAETRRRRCADR